MGGPRPGPTGPRPKDGTGSSKSLYGFGILEIIV